MAVENIGLVAVTENAAQKVAVKVGGKIKAQAGTKYLLQVENSDVAPENVTVKRVGKDLQISFEGSEKPDLTIENFFAEGMDSQLYGVAEDGQLYAYVRTDGEGFYGQLLMDDGESAPIALGGDSLGSIPVVNGEYNDAAGFLLWPLLAGAAALGGAAYAVHKHNQDDGHKTKTSVAPTNTKVIDDVGPIQGELHNGDITDDSHPEISGNGVPGAIIHISDNGKEIGSTTVGPNGTWSFTPALNDGPHSLDVTQEIPGQKPSEHVKVIDIVVDIDPPSEPTAEIAGAKSDGGHTYSNDDTPAIHGKGEPGDTIIIIFPTGETVTTIVDPQGNWVAPTPTQPLPEGENDIKVIEQDPAGNQTEIVVPVIIDITPPDAPKAVLDPASDTGIKGDDITSETKPTIDGKTEPGADITVIFPNGEEIHTKADDNGNWSVTPTQPLPEGQNDITVIATDPAGNKSEPTVITVVVDTIVPDAPKTMLDPASDSGTKGDGITNDSKPTIDGKTEPGADITVTFPTGEVVTTTADANGEWHVTPTQPLPEGHNDITIVATDPAGNHSEPTVIDVIIDTTAPDAPAAWLDPASDSGTKGDGITSDTKPTIDGKTEPGADVTVTFPTGEVIHTKADANGEWHVTPTQSLPEGKNDITVLATDPAGNQSEPTVVHVVIDTTPPDASKLAITGVLDDVGLVTGNIENGGSTDDAHPIISGTGTAGDTIVVYTKDVTGNNHAIGSAVVNADGNWSVTPELPLASGLNELTAVETDPSGNSTTSQPYAISLEMGAPTSPTIESVYDDVGPYQGFLQKGSTTDDSKPTFAGSAQAGSIVKLYDEHDKLIGSTTADAKGHWSITPEVALADGEHAVHATATNAVGVISEPTGPWNFSIDTQAPSNVSNLVVTDDVGAVTGPLHNGDTTDDNHPTFSGDAEPNGKVIIYDNGKKIGEADVNPSGKWEFTPTEPLADGPHAFTTEVVDPAGNGSGQNAPLNVNVDTSALGVNIIHVIDDVGSITGDISLHGVTDDKRPEIQGTSKPGSIVKISDNGVELGSTVADAKGNWSFTPSQDMAEGKHDIVAIATDKAGNISAPSKFDFTTDYTAPTKPSIDSITDDVGAIQGPVKNGGITDDSTPTLAGKAEAGSTVTLYDNGQKMGSEVADADGKWSYTPSSPISEGAHEFTVDATDKAGNTSAKSDPFSIFTDYTAPDADKLAITGVQDNVGDVTGNVAEGGKTDDSRPVISGTGTAGDTITVYANDSTGNHKIGTATVGEDGKWSLHPETPLNVGPNQLTAVETDPVGNSTEPSKPYSFIFDPAEPGVPVIVNVLDDVGPYTGFLQKGDVTDDNKPTINGTAEANSIVKLYDGNNVLIGSATSDADGNWSITPATALADGKHDIYATATNSVGVVSEPTGKWDFIVDTTAPSNVSNLVVTDDVGPKTGQLFDGDTTDDNRPTFSGDAEPNGKVIIYDNGTAIGSTTAGTDGKWSFTPTTPLKDGDHKFTTEVLDKAGNSSGQNDPLNVIVDTSKIGVAITHLIDDVGSITGDIALGGVTDDKRPEIQGTSKPGSIVKIYDGSVVLGSTVADSKGNWSLTPSKDLAEGAHNITAIATDKAGVVSEPAKFAFSVDTTAPTKPSIDSITDDVGAIQGPIKNGGITDDSTPTLSGKAEAGSTVTLYDNGQKMGSVIADKDGNWTYTPTTPISEGKHDFTADATDRAGNTSAKSDPFSIVTDYTAPDASKLAITGVDDSVGTITGNVTNGGITDDPRPAIHGIGTAGDLVTVYSSDSTGNHKVGSAVVDADGKWSMKPELPLNVGLNDLTAVETDPAGNSTQPCAKYSITFDATAPAAPVIVSVLDDVGPYQGFLQKGDVTDDSKPTFAGSAQAGSLVKLYDSNNVLIGSTTADSKGAWSITPSAALADGKHEVYATATNSVGVVSEPTGKWDFIVDTQAPSNVSNLVVIDDVGAVTGQLHNGDTTDDNRPTFKGDAEPNSKVVIYDNGTAIGSTTAGSDGKWNFTPTAALADGSHEFTTEVVDKAGNSSGQGNKLDVTVDTSGVGVAITHVIDDVGSITGDIAPHGVTDDKRPEIQGTSKPGSIVKIYDGSVVLGSVTADSKGNWTFTPSGDLGEGAHTVQAIATDKAGVVSLPAKFDFTIDVTAPTKPSIDSITDDVGAIQGPVKNGGITDDSTPTLAGKAEANSAVTIYDNGAKLGSVTADKDGNWTYTPTTPISEGEHKFTVDSTDKAGNTSIKSDPFTIVTDYTAPDAGKLAITGVDDSVGTITGNVANGGTTDDPRPVIHGTGTAGDLITVYTKDSTGNHKIGTATVGADGKWTLKPELPLVSGLNDLTAVETDAAGNSTQPTSKYSITLDSSAPQAPVIVSVLDDVGPYQGFLQKGDVTDDSKPTVAGTAQAGSIVRLYDNNNTLIGSTTADSKGAWSITPSAALADGKHEVYATATNSVGVVSEPTGKWDFTVDTSKPSNVSNLVVTDHVGDVTGPLHNGDTTDDNKPTFSGNAEPNGKVVIYDNGTAIGSAAVDADGKWSFTPTTALADGDHKFTTEVLDKAGNSSGQGDKLDVIVDTSKISVAITHVIDDVGSITGDIALHGVTDDKRPEIQGIAKVGSIVKILDGSVVLGSVTADSKGSWTFTPSGDLGEGAHTLTAVATDKTGNTATSSPFGFTIDVTAPNKPSIDSITDDVGAIQGPVKNGGITDDSTPTLAGQAEANSTVTVYDNGAKLGSVTADKNGNWTYTPTTPISEGEHKFTVDSTDKAGNTSAKSDPFTIVTDYTAPDSTKLAITGVDDNVGTITGNVNNGGTTDDPRPVIHGTGTAGDTITVYTKDSTGNHKIGTATVGADGKWTLKPELPLVSGLNDLTAVETDVAGNSTQPTSKYSITLDTSVPQAPVIVSVLDDVGPYQGFLQKGDITDDSKPTVAGTAQAGSVVRLYDNNNALIGSATADSKGAWSITPSTALADGKHEVYATSTNSVGVVSEPTGKWDFTVDTSKPSNVSNLVVTDHVGDVTGPLHNGDTTDDNKPTFSGNAEPNGKVFIYDNGTALGSAAVDADGKWSFTPTTALTDGDHKFTTEVLDKAGNSSGQGDKLDVIVDTSKIAVAITHVIDDVGSITGDITQGGVTDDKRPEIQGIAKVGSIVKILDGSVVLGSVTADSKGNWTFTPSGELGEGAHSITAAATDKTGNTATSSPFGFTIDVTAPNKPSIDSVTDDVGAIQGPVKNGGVTDDSTPTLAGKSEANSTVTVYDNGAKLGSVTADKNGNWTYTPTTPISEGEHKFTVDATDKAGNTSAKSDPFTVITDYSGPDASSTHLSIDTVAGDDIVNKDEAAGNVKISGTATGEFTAGDKVNFTLNGHAYSASVAADGKWSVNVPGADLTADSAHKINATLVAHDAAGNVGNITASHAYTVATSAPDNSTTQLSIDTIAGDDIVNLAESQANQAISGKATGVFKAGDIVSFTLNGHAYSAAVAADGKWNVSVPGTDLKDDSVHKINATLVAHDAAGNAGNITASHAYAVDVTPPGPSTTTLTIDTVAGDDIVNAAEAAANQTVSGKATGEFKAGDIVSFKLNGTTYSAAVAADGKWSVSVPGSALVGEASHTIAATLVAHDAAGNAGNITASHAYTVDTSAPDSSTTTLTIDTVAGDDIVNLTESQTNQTVSGKATGEFKAGDIVSFKLNGTTYSAAVAADGKWSVSVPGSALVGETSHTIAATLVAHDAAGNAGNITASHAYTVDTSVPDSTTTTLTIDTVAGDDIVNLAESQTNQTVSGKATGEFKAGDIVSFKLNGTTYSAAVAADGKWSVSVPGSALVGETSHSIAATLVAHDAAGNAGNITASHAYTVDTTAPDSSTTTLTIDPVTGDDIVNNVEAAANQNITGKVTGEFKAGDVVSFTLNGHAYSTTVAVDGKWNVSVPGADLKDDSAHKINATVVAHDVAGNAGSISASHPYQVQLNSVSITSMSKDSANDAAHSNDFITSDGGAGRGVYGTLTQALTGTQKVQVSFDGGASWKDAATNGLNWTTVDTSAHNANWTIQARVVDGGVVQTDVASQAVSFLGAVGGAPTITGIPDAVGTYTTAKAALGSDVNVSLAGTNAKAGDTLHIVWGDTTYDQVLTAANITAGTVTAKIPAQQTPTQGGQWDFGVTAQIVTPQGQISSPSAALQVHSQGWETLAIDDLNRNVMTMGTQTVYQGGGVTITSNATMSHTTGDSTANPGLWIPNAGSATTNYAQLNFTVPVSKFSLNISGLENTNGGSRVVVYDTKGNVLSDSYAVSDGTGGIGHSKNYSYNAPIGTDIGKVTIYGDGADGNGNAGGAIILDTLKFQQVHHAPGYNDTFTNEVGKTSGYHSDEGHFTMTAKGSVSIKNVAEHNLDGPYLYIGTGSSAISDSAATFTFDQPVQSISYNLWGLETQQKIAGNGSWLEVYDTNGTMIFNRYVVNNGGSTYNYEQVSYTAPEGVSIGKAVVYQDQNGTLLDNFTTVLAPSAPSGQKLIDHNWETYYDEASVTKGIVWQGQSFAVPSYSGGASLANYHSTGGGFTITGPVTKTASGSLWTNATSGSMYVDSGKTAIVTFDSARSKVEIGITGIENTAGNAAVMKVYSTDGNLLDTIQMSNPIGTYDIQSFSYESSSNNIGRIEITGDSAGSHVTSISSAVTQVTANSDVVSLVIDPVAYFAQDGAHIHGSSGLDTLKLTGANQVLDLRSLTGDHDQAKISSIEKFDITGTGNNTLKLSLNDVLNLGETNLFKQDGKVQVMVDGDAGDKVELSNLHDHGSAPGTWQNAGTATISGATYNVYSYSNLDAEVLIKQAVTSTLV